MSTLLPTKASPPQAKLVNNLPKKFFQIIGWKHIMKSRISSANKSEIKFSLVLVSETLNST